MEIPSLNLDKLKQFSTNDPKISNIALNKKEVMSERGPSQSIRQQTQAKKKPDFEEEKLWREAGLSVDHQTVR